MCWLCPGLVDGGGTPVQDENAPGSDAEEEMRIESCHSEVRGLSSKQDVFNISLVWWSSPLDSPTILHIQINILKIFIISQGSMLTFFYKEKCRCTHRHLGAQ